MKEVDWMDQQSRDKALQKAELIDTKIGYDEKIKNDTYINEIYKDVRENAWKLWSWSLKITRV